MSSQPLTEVERRNALERALTEILGVRTMIVPFNENDHITVPERVANHIHQLATSPDGGGGYVINHRWVEASDEWGKQRGLCGVCNSRKTKHMVQG